MTSPRPLGHGSRENPSAAAGSHPHLSPLESRILILAPTTNDAALSAEFLSRAGLPAWICRSLSDLCREIENGAGAILLAEEVLYPAAAEAIATALKSQPPWSDIPVTLVCSSGERSHSHPRYLGLLGPAVTVSLIERPFRPETLISVMEAALRSRKRQYQLRDLLTKIAAGETRLRLMLEQTIVGLAETDLSGRFTRVNQRYCEIAGRERDAMLQSSLPELAHPDDREATRQRLDSLALGHSSSYIVEKRYLQGDGSTVWVHDHVSSMRDTTGQLCGFTVATIDITERKRVEEALAAARDEAVAASRAKDDFLASLSHELRTPLNPVLLLASEGAQNPDLPPSVKADFETIARNVALEARLIDDLLDLTRITRGKLQIERQLHSLHGILEDAIATVQPDFVEKRIVVHRTLLPTPPLVYADAVRLQQVFWNILKNAAKFTPRGGSVTIRTRLNFSNTHVLVEVTDTGIGLRAHELGRIFDAFVQGEHAGRRAHHFGGLGLGLAISKRLVDLHSGRISAHSDGPGTGSTFTIELPVATETTPVRAPAGAPEPSVASLALSSKRVLLVDDHEPTRNALAHLLRRRNFEVVSAGSLEEAFARAEDGGVELLISDIGLPDGTGYELMERLGKTHGIKGIALTGYGMEEDVALSARAGFAAHLTKPVRIDALDEALKNVLGLGVASA